MIEYGDPMICKAEGTFVPDCGATDAQKLFLMDPLTKRLPMGRHYRDHLKGLSAYDRHKRFVEDYGEPTV
jgi:hypothetical protein